MCVPLAISHPQEKPPGEQRGRSWDLSFPLQDLERLFEAYGIKVGDPLSFLLTRGCNLAFPSPPSGILEVTFAPTAIPGRFIPFLFPGYISMFLGQIFWFFPAILWGVGGFEAPVTVTLGS